MIAVIVAMVICFLKKSKMPERDSDDTSNEVVMETVVTEDPVKPSIELPAGITVKSVIGSGNFGRI